jgi:hypothetical protein
MIPSQQTLKARVTPQILSTIILNKPAYFETAEEFIEMNKIFVKDTLFDRVMIWVDMVISPLITLISAAYYGEAPSIFSIMGLYKTVSMWNDWIYFQILKAEVHEWTGIVKSIGGPFIATNDPTYHSYVYADGMQRLHYACMGGAPSLPKN